MSIDRQLVIEHHEEGQPVPIWRVYLSIIDDDTGFKHRVSIADFGREYQNVAKEFVEWFNRKLREPISTKESA